MADSTLERNLLPIAGMFTSNGIADETTFDEENAVEKILTL